MNKERPSLTVVRRIKASPAKVYAAWTRPEVLARWWGPDGGPVLSAEADPRGRFRIVFQTLDGMTHECQGEYREVVPERKLVFTWEWAATPDRRFPGNSRSTHDTGWSGTRLHPCAIRRRNHPR